MDTQPQPETARQEPLSTPISFFALLDAAEAAAGRRLERAVESSFPTNDPITPDSRE